MASENGKPRGNQDLESKKLTYSSLLSALGLVLSAIVGVLDYPILAIVIAVLAVGGPPVAEIIARRMTL